MGFAKKLDSLQSKVAFRVLLLLNANINVQSEEHNNSLARLAHEKENIVEVLTISQAKMQSTIGNILLSHEASAACRHESIVSAILTLKDGESRTLTEAVHLGNHDQSALIKDESEQTFVTLRSDQTGGPSTVKVQNHLPSLFERAIINSLYFRHITDRVDDVSLAHKKTFEWVFSHSSFENTPWDNLPNWLEQGSGCYWVNGKAGAGKSTLLKFIREDPRTKVLLQTWASNSVLIFASFFFWNLGSKLQRSQEGLLRALLHDVLQTQPSLAADLLPGQYRAAVHGRAASLTEPSIIELKKGFQKLIGLTSHNVKICLFIDGIDEYDGDHTELSQILAGIPSHSCVKALVSSRPLAACVETFSGCPHLLVQDLTKHDVQTYVSARVSNPNFQGLSLDNGLQAARFLEDIVNKASGVFLWVIIVVRNILEGLCNGDNLEELAFYLHELPEDLNTLYDHMLRKLKPIYQTQASEIFQMVFRSISLDIEEPLTAMHLAHIGNQDPEIVLQQPMGAMSRDERYIKTTSIEARIRSRCCGLVEVLPDWSLPTEERCISSRISFLHRTVAEFLQNEQVWNGLLELTSEHNFDVNISLLAAYLMEVKTSEPDDVVDTKDEPAWRNMRACLVYGRTAEENDPVRIRAFLDELEIVMNEHWASTIAFRAGAYGIESPSNANQNHWSVTLFRSEVWMGEMPKLLEHGGSIYSALASFGIAQYLKYRLSHPSDTLSHVQIQHALVTSLMSQARNFRTNCSLVGPRNSSRLKISKFARFLTNDAVIPSINYVAITESLLKTQQQDVGGLDRVSTSWTEVLLLTIKLTNFSMGVWNSLAEDEIFAWIKLLEKFILQGVDVNFSVQIGSEHSAQPQSAYKIVTLFLQSLSSQALQSGSIVIARDQISSLLKSRSMSKIERVGHGQALGISADARDNRRSSPTPSVLSTPARGVQKLWRVFKRD